MPKPAEAETVLFRPPGRLRDEYLAVRVSGGCLEPDSADGTTAIVDKAIVAQYGDLVPASREDDLLVKYLQLREGGQAPGGSPAAKADQGRQPDDNYRRRRGTAQQGAEVPKEVVRGLVVGLDRGAA